METPERPHAVFHAPEPPAGGRVVPPSPLASTPKERLQQFLKRHGKKLWWLHSAYALGLGITIVAVAQKGFDHARMLAVSLGLAWLLVVVFFRVFGSGKEQVLPDAADKKAKVRFFVMTYALKNLYQGMLFFLLPFYWKATTFDGANGFFVLLLGGCALLSTLDLVFDRVLLRFAISASVFHGITLFSCLNLVIPALFPDTRTLYSLVGAAGITAMAFWSVHVRLQTFRRRRYIALFVGSVVASMYVAYLARRAVPPVPMYIAHGAVGPQTLANGRLSMEVTTLSPEVIEQLLGVTDVVVPGGKGDRLRHVWRRDGAVVHSEGEDTSRVDGPLGTIRLRSALKGQALPKELRGQWSVDVETEDGQLVGRTRFRVGD